MGKRRVAFAGVAALAMVGVGLFGGTAASADPAMPAIDVPATIESGEQLTISGVGCWSIPDFPRGTVLLSVDGEVTTISAGRDQDGTWSWITPALSPGTVTVAASCDSYGGVFEYDVSTVEVVDRATLAAPASAVAGTTITVTGTGWGVACDCMAPPIDLTLSDGTSTWLLSSSWNTANGKQNPAWTQHPGGEFSAAVVLPTDSPRGEYVLSGAQPNFHNALATVMIAADGEPLPATIALSNTSLTPGGNVDVSGTGFEPGEEVRVELRPGATLATVTAAADGTIAIRVTVPAATAASDYEIVLVGVDSNQTASKAITVSVVTSGGDDGGEGTGDETAGSGNGSSVTGLDALAATGGAAPIALAGIAALLLSMGAAAMWMRRRSVRA